MADIIMPIMSYKEIGEKGANYALDEFEYNGLTIRQWADKITSRDYAPVVHGHWTTECYNIPICSICGTYVSKDVYNSEDFTPKFCPNCGAKMDEN